MEWYRPPDTWEGTRATTEFFLSTDLHLAVSGEASPLGAIGLILSALNPADDKLPRYLKRP